MFQKKDFMHEFRRGWNMSIISLKICNFYACKHCTAASYSHEAENCIDLRVTRNLYILAWSLPKNCVRTFE